MHTVFGVVESCSLMGRLDDRSMGTYPHWCRRTPLGRARKAREGPVGLWCEVPLSGLQVPRRGCGSRRTPPLVLNAFNGGLCCGCGA